ncbi:MAG: M81 family metallopeptidase [Myxococcales bacterium]|nr:M81 family metallopeptidase [Myxococcales bacterium]
MGRLRLGFLRVYHESNAFSERMSTRRTFERYGQVFRGPELDAHLARGYEIGGYVKRAEYAGFLEACGRNQVEGFALFNALLLPTGPITSETMDWLRQEVVDALQSCGALDGVVLALHGAARAEGGIPVDAEILALVRDQLPPSVPIVASYDLHANLTASRREGLLALSAYHTNPHRDLRWTGRKVTEILIRSLRGEIEPVSTWRKLPVFLGGALGVDFLPPMLAVTTRVRLAERRARVLDVSLCINHPFADDADLGWAVNVTTDGDQALAEELADAFADRIWATRHHPIPASYPLEEAIGRVRASRWARRLGVVSMVDTGDVVAAGAEGNSTDLLVYLQQEARDLRALLPICDEGAVERLWDEPVGAAVSVEVGPPRARTVLEGRIMHHRDGALGRGITVDAGPAQVVLSDMPPLTIRPEFYTEAGLDPFSADIVVQKSFFHYLVRWPRYHRKAIHYQGRGATDLRHVRSLQLPYDAYPTIDLPDWRAHDRKVREQG